METIMKKYSKAQEIKDYRKVKLLGFLTFAGILAIALMVSCSTQRYCTPSKGSRDYAVCIKVLKDGTYWVTTTRYNIRTDARYECLPDSLKKYL